MKLLVWGQGERGNRGVVKTGLTASQDWYGLTGELLL